MPVGSVIVEKVAKQLSVETGTRTADLAENIEGCSSRAIRYAVTRLIDEGRARRSGHLIFAAIPEVETAALAPASELENA